MRRFVQGVAALSACWFLGLGVAPTSRAQPAIPTEPRPYFYMWGAPQTGGWGNVAGFASQIVRQDARFQSAALTGALAAAKARDQTGLNDPNYPNGVYTTDLNKVCILLEGYGHWEPNNANATPRESR
jgi:hypothetical protein